MQTDQRQNATAKSVTVIDTDIVKLKQSNFAIASHYLAAAFGFGNVYGCAILRAIWF
jgi:hypothetical protein